MIDGNGLLEPDSAVEMSDRDATLNDCSSCEAPASLNG